MLGWEYPPHISGGLGTACQGLTISLAKKNHDITFVVPHLFGNETAHHMDLISSAGTTIREVVEAGEATIENVSVGSRIKKSTQRHVSIASLLSPYLSAEQYQQALESYVDGQTGSRLVTTPGANVLRHVVEGKVLSADCFKPYGENVFSEVERYAQQVVSTFADETFDVVHAHDWMTIPAALLMASVKKIPFVLHVHSLEHDRSGAHPNPEIEAIESLGMRHATTVVAVSHYTKRIIEHRFATESSRVKVVHNGVYPEQSTRFYRKSAGGKKRVLFLGRVTMQKGPDYFVEAAAKIIPHIPNIEFIVAGAGDMLPRLRARVHELGIQSNFAFPGFLKNREVERAYALADVYVMPSVSEPFGISALEAIKFETPVIVSKQSGVSEVLSHALKVDFWDINKLADCIINALLYPELREDMLAMAREEVKSLHWDAAADKVNDIYTSLQ